MKNKLIYNSQYQNLHLDRAMPDSMKTVDIHINSNFASSSTPRLLYRYYHNLGYVPQFWGLWDVQYGSGLGNFLRRSYGRVIHNTGFGTVADFIYDVDSVSVGLYMVFSLISPDPNIYTSGTHAVFTGYLFSNGLDAQDYTN